jgi:hypothetical protein
MCDGADGVSYVGGPSGGTTWVVTSGSKVLAEQAVLDPACGRRWQKGRAEPAMLIADILQDKKNANFTLF